MSILWFGAIGIAGIASAWQLCRQAVDGYQDDAGFHYADPSAAASQPLSTAGPQAIPSPA